MLHSNLNFDSLPLPGIVSERKTLVKTVVSLPTCGLLGKMKKFLSRALLLITVIVYNIAVLAVAMELEYRNLYVKTEGKAGLSRNWGNAERFI